MPTAARLTQSDVCWPWAAGIGCRRRQASQTPESAQIHKHARLPADASAQPRCVAGATIRHGAKEVCAPCPGSDLLAPALLHPYGERADCDPPRGRS